MQGRVGSAGKKESYYSLQKINKNGRSNINIEDEN